MRLAVLLLTACALFGQTGSGTGKPGVTDPIKDPQQMPGKANPGPMPRSTPDASASATGDQAHAGKSKGSKKTKKQAKERVSPPAQ